MNEHKKLIDKDFFGDAQGNKKMMLVASDLHAQGKFEDATSRAS